MIVLGDFFLFFITSDEFKSLCELARAELCFHKHGNERKREGCTGERVKKSGKKTDNKRENYVFSPEQSK